MIYELITGDFLFEPRKGPNYKKTEDHLAQMIELLGPMPKNFALSGRSLEKFFVKEERPEGSFITMRNIKGLQYFPLENLLVEKYRIKAEEAK